MPPTNQSLFPAFNRLSENVWYSDHTKPTDATELKARTKAPHLVILATWMAAPPRAVAKYIVGYQTLYPQAHILLIRNGLADIIMRSNAHLAKQLQPALTIVDKFRHEPSSRILLHLMSNGGGIMARNLAVLFRDRYSEPLPINTMVLDSSPGLEGFGTAMAAFSVGLPGFLPLRLLSKGLLFAALLCLFVANKAFRVEPFIVRLRKDLNNDRLFPTNAPRLYIYSLKDRMVMSNHVEKHAEDAKEKGWIVKTDKFLDSEHVAHMMVDGERYWKNVAAIVSL
jgi:hypothetical protein